jgi:hypothetical protein
VTVAQSCSGSFARTVFAASKTWVGSVSTGGWALTINRYDYSGGDSMDLEPLVYPAAPNATNYFVPVGMEVYHDACEDAQSDEAIAANTWIVVTGYSPAPAYGTTDYHTVCFNGNLTFRWAHTYSRPGALSTELDEADEYPVDIELREGVRYLPNNVSFPTLIAGVTGNTWNGSDWDTQTVFYDVFNNGDIIQVITEASSGNLDDKACGIRMLVKSEGPYNNIVAYVVGTQGESAGNTLAAYRYTTSQSDPTLWVKDSRTLSLSGVTLKANAMDGDYVSGTAGDMALAAGQYATSTQSHMLLAKFDFCGSAGYYTTFSYDGGGSSPRAGEALAMKYYHHMGTPSFIALAGYGYRNSSYGTDALVCLYQEVSGSPVLRWTAWQNLSDTAYNVHDVSSTVGIDASHATGGNDPDGYIVYVAGQVPTSSSDLNWRAVVFSTDDAGVTPGNPSTKSPWSNVVDISGSTSGGDLPRDLDLNPFSETHAVGEHNFIVIGDVWNGSTLGFDVALRRFRFMEPE